MIISDRYRFVFIHNPKCAGSYVRRKLVPYDTTDGQFNSGVHLHPVLGLLDQQHIPLQILRLYFPSEFERLQRYSSYAVLRDPIERFPSSLAQRLKESGMAELHTLSRVDLKREVEIVINYLSQHDAVTDPAFIHFARQSSYVELDGERVVENLYTVGNVDVMLHDISNLIGAELVRQDQVSVVNQTNVYRNEILRRTFEALRPFVSGPVLTLLPERVKKSIRGALYIPRNEKTHDVFNSDTIQSFIRDYYHLDFEVYKSVRQHEECAQKMSASKNEVV